MYLNKYLAAGKMVFIIKLGGLCCRKMQISLKLVVHDQRNQWKRG